MALKFFLTYIGITTVIAIALSTVASKLSASFAAFGRKPLVNGLLIALSVAIITFGTSYILDSLFLLFWVLGLIFLLFGWLHMAVTHNKFVYYDSKEKFIVLGAEIFFSLAVLFFSTVLFSILQYFVKDKSFLFYPILFSFLMFIIPLFIYHTYLFAYNIPQSVFSIWEYPVGQVIDPPDERDNEQLLVIGFEIPKKISDNTKTYFRAKTPENIVLGELFYHFINDYNELQSETPVQFLDKNNKPIGWWFRLKRKWYQPNKVLDPSVTVRENRIKENSVIICEHIIN